MTTTEMDSDTGTGSTAGNGSGDARERVRETVNAARSRANDAYNAARERTSAAFSSASQQAGRASEKVTDGIDANPIAALVGGLALGGLLAAILPKTQREEELVGDYGRKINDRARDVVRAAKEAGVTKLDELGYNRDNAKQKIQSLRSDVAEIASAAAERIKGDASQVASAAAQEAKGAVQQ
jgi:hypothetical protein